MKSSRKQNFKKPGPKSTTWPILQTCPWSLASAGAPGLAQTQKGTQVSSSLLGLERALVSNTPQNTSEESSQVKSHGLPHRSLTSSTRAASLSIFSSSSFLWEMSFIRDVDISMASCSFLWNVRAGQHQWAQKQLPATTLVSAGQVGALLPGELWHYSSPAEGSLIPWPSRDSFVMCSMSHCSTAHGAAAGV